MTLVDRVEQVGRRGLDERTLRAEVLAAVRGTIGFDAYAWVLTDPRTEVGASPLAETPSVADLPTLIRLKYLTAVNRWTGLAPDEVVTLAGATGGNLRASALWSGLLHGYGVDDIASTVFRDGFGCWGFLDLWRCGAAFAEPERSELARVAATVTPALRQALAATFVAPPGAAEPEPEPEPGAEPGSESGRAGSGHEPVVLLLDDELTMQTQTATADAHLRALLPTEQDRAPVPAAALNVAAQLLAREAGIDAHPAWARVALGSGRWCTLRAARLVGGPSGGSRAGGASVADGSRGTIAVSIERSTPTERVEVYARVVGLSPRETDVLGELIRGADTRTVAGRLFVSEHTVQDHLKAMFAKAGVRSRPALIARATGTG